MKRKLDKFISLLLIFCMCFTTSAFAKSETKSSYSVDASNIQDSDNEEVEIDEEDLDTEEIISESKEDLATEEIVEAAKENLDIEETAEPNIEETIAADEEEALITEETIEADAENLDIEETAEPNIDENIEETIAENEEESLVTEETIEADAENLDIEETAEPNIDVNIEETIAAESRIIDDVLLNKTSDDYIEAEYNDVSVYYAETDKIAFSVKIDDMDSEHNISLHAKNLDDESLNKYKHILNDQNLDNIDIYELYFLDDDLVKISSSSDALYKELDISSDSNSKRVFYEPAIASDSNVSPEIAIKQYMKIRLEFKEKIKINDYVIPKLAVLSEDKGVEWKDIELETDSENNISALSYNDNTLYPIVILLQKRDEKIQMYADYESYQRSGNASLVSDFNIDAKNSWQIVSGLYEGNHQANKIKHENAVWIQKNIVPTDIENEFKVYMSISKRVAWKEIMKECDLVLTTSNKYHKYKIGSTFNWINGNYGTVNSNKNNGHLKYDATISIKRNGHVIKKEKLKLYGSVPHCNNGTAFVKIDGKYILTSKSASLKNGSTDIKFTIDLDKLEDAGIYYEATPVKLINVEDNIADYIIYDDLEYSDGSVGISNKKLTWTIKEKENIPISRPISRKTEGFFYNVAELVYKIKLDVEKDGFNSCAQNMDSIENDKESYPIGTNTKLLYEIESGEKEAAFKNPYIRGLLYDFELIKIDENGNPLIGDLKAKFRVSKNNKGIFNGPVDDEGKIQVINKSWGIYRYKEIRAPYSFPYNYKSNNNEYAFNMCYTENPKNMKVSHINKVNMMMNNAPIKFKNIAKKGNLEIEKSVENYPGFCDESFKLKLHFTKDDKSLNLELPVERYIFGENKRKWKAILKIKDGIATLNIAPGEKIVIIGLPEGTNYSIEETDIPKYYDVEYKNKDGKIKEDGNSCEIINRYNPKGYELPDTGGIGRHINNAIGLIIIILSLTFLIKEREILWEE